MDNKLFFLQNFLLDLLGSSSDAEIIKPSIPQSQPISNTNNQDLLDLLGGLDPSPSLPAANTSLALITENNNGTLLNTNNQNSNFLAGDLFNTNIIDNSELSLNIMSFNLISSNLFQKKMCLLSQLLIKMD